MINLCIFKFIYILHYVIKLNLLHFLTLLGCDVRITRRGILVLVLRVFICLQLLCNSVLHFLKICFILELYLKSQIQTCFVKFLFIFVLIHHLFHVFCLLPALDLLRLMDVLILVQELPGKSRHPQHLLQARNQFYLLIELLLQFLYRYHVQICFNISVVN